MKITQFEYNNKTSTQVYLLENELNTPYVISKLEELKRQYKNVVVFVSGGKDLKNTLSNIISLYSNL